MELAFINLGTWEIVGIVAVGILLFGSRLPSIARSLGKSVTEFKKGVKDIQHDMDEPEPKKLENKAREVDAETVEKSEAEK
ncbi:MAG: twin-arginine translocase TatA/TatE family subunit, partial [Planctomycetes bacterium]|nr:twin-arginine translocase TatA/TatE family subunit [Planctomycetota bacterium]